MRVDIGCVFGWWGSHLILVRQVKGLGQERHWFVSMKDAYIFSLQQSYRRASPGRVVWAFVMTVIIPELTRGDDEGTGIPPAEVRIT